MVRRSLSPGSEMVMTLHNSVRNRLKTDLWTNHVPNTEQLSCRSAEGDVGAGEVVHGRLGEHGIVLELRLAQWGAVTRDQHKLGWRGRRQKGSAQGPSQPHAPVPGESCIERCSPLQLRICFKADLYPRVYLPDLTTSVRRAPMDSVDYAAFDFLVAKTIQS